MQLNKSPIEIIFNDNCTFFWGLHRYIHAKNLNLHGLLLLTFFKGEMHLQTRIHFQTIMFVFCFVINLQRLLDDEWACQNIASQNIHPSSAVNAPHSDPEAFQTAGSFSRKAGKASPSYLVRGTAFSSEQIMQTKTD